MERMTSMDNKWLVISFVDGEVKFVKFTSVNDARAFAGDVDLVVTKENLLRATRAVLAEDDPRKARLFIKSLIANGIGV